VALPERSIIYSISLYESVLLAKNKPLIAEAFLGTFYLSKAYLCTKTDT
jgi:hypothetical protein